MKYASNCIALALIVATCFPGEKTFGFHLAGMVGHDFFKPFAVTFDFETMRIFLTNQPASP
jgi:hypothetical protein